MVQLVPLLLRKLISKNLAILINYWVHFYLDMLDILIVERAQDLHTVKLAQLLCELCFILTLCNLAEFMIQWYIGDCRKRIFILGPSHHVRLRGCALSIADKYETPLYDLKIDTSVNRELEQTGEFSWMDMTTDENEHSIEMHLPYIAKVMEG